LEVVRGELAEGLEKNWLRIRKTFLEKLRNPSLNRTNSASSCKTLPRLGTS
jgi:hypothetical protein